MYIRFGHEVHTHNKVENFCCFKQNAPLKWITELVSRKFNYFTAFLKDSIDIVGFHFEMHNAFKLISISLFLFIYRYPFLHFILFILFIVRV